MDALSTPAINLAKFDLVSIRLAVLCVQEGTLSRAARRANLSLSGASHRLRQFEEALGQQLFKRQFRGLTPTRAGKAVAEHGRTILAAVARLNVEIAVQSVASPPAREYAR